MSVFAPEAIGPSVRCGHMRRERRMNRHDSSYRPRGPAFELLERRLLLDGAAGEAAIELLNISPALFVENQGQWADPAVRYAFQGSGANVLVTDAGPVFQVFQRDPAGEEPGLPGGRECPGGC